MDESPVVMVRHVDVTGDLSEVFVELACVLGQGGRPPVDVIVGQASALTYMLFLSVHTMPISAQDVALESIFKGMRQSMAKYQQEHCGDGKVS